MKKTKIIYTKFLLIPVTLLLLLFFFTTLFGSAASAETCVIDEMKGYESVLIKDGDTLSSVAASYAKEYSYFSEEDYQEAIAVLNNLSSEYIQSGNYLLLPQYR